MLTWEETDALTRLARNMRLGTRGQGLATDRDLLAKGADAIEDLMFRLTPGAFSTAMAHRAEGPVDPAPLRDDGPTIEQYVLTGYKPETYPPVGYAERPSAGLTRYQTSGAVFAPNPLEVGPQQPNPNPGDAPEYPKD